MRSLANRRALLLVLGGVLTAVLLIVLRYPRDADDDTPLDAPEGSATPAAALPALPAGCQSFLASYRLDDLSPSTVGRASPIEVHASDCAVATFAGIPIERLSLTIAFRQQAPDGPSHLEVVLPAEHSAEGLIWRGEVVYSEPGVWEPTFHLGAIEELAGYVEVLDTDLDLAERPGLPLPAMTLPLTVIDAVDGAVTTWDASQSNGIGWLRGEAGAAARAVWVQQRDGASWVVAGNTDTGEVTSLLEVRADPSPQLIAAPDGSAVVVVEIAHAGAPTRIRMVRHDLAPVVDLSAAVDTTAGSYPGVSWSPDASVLLMFGEELHVLNSDGTERFSSPEGSRHAPVVTWAPDSASALVMLDILGPHGAPTQRLVRVDLDTGTVEAMLDYGAGIERGFYGNPLAISPDGTRVAFTWVDTTDERVLRLAMLPIDEPFSSDINAAAVISIPVPAPALLRSYLASPVWSPDGEWIAFVTTTPDDQGGDTFASRVSVVNADSGDVREVHRAPAGYYVGSAWSPDGTAIFAQRLSAIESHGGTSNLDVIDASTGAVVRTHAAATLSVTFGEDQLLLAPGEILATGGIESPRTLLRAERLVSYSPILASPDGGQVAVLGLPGAVHTIAAIDLDGSADEVLGTFERGPTYPAGLRGVEAVLAPDSSGIWTWLPLGGGAPERLPLPPEATADAMAGRYASLGLAPDHRQAAYWTWLHADDPLPRLTILDIATGTTRLIDVPLERPDAASRGPIGWSPSADRIAFADGGRTLMTVDLASGSSHAIDLAEAGVRDAPPLPGVVAFSWDTDGAHIDLVWGRQLWRVDLAARTAVETAPAPLPGGWWGNVVLTRSPDGSLLAAGTPFGVFVQNDGGAWRRISRAGVAPQQSALLWSSDGSQIAYAADGGPGIVVAAVDGGEAYELVTAWPGAQLLALSWLADGRLAYGVLVQGI